MGSHHSAVRGTRRVVVTVHQCVNDHGAMTVEIAESNEQRQVVEFEEGLREVFADLPEGSRLPVEMQPLHSRGNCWRLTDIGPRGRGDVSATRPRA